MNRKFLATSFASMFVLACAMVCPAGAGGGHDGGGHGGGSMMSGGSMKGGGGMMVVFGPTGPSMGASSLACKTGKEHSSRCRRVRSDYSGVGQF
jgi:hypothetical protein